MQPIIKSKLLQIGKKQDDLFQGTSTNPSTGECYQYAIIIDGHGDNTGVNHIRTILQTDMDTILNSENPHLEIQTRLDHQMQTKIDQLQPSFFAERAKTNILYNTYNSGSTFLCTKVYANRAELLSVGDSEIYVVKNDEIVYHTPIHNWENVTERERLQNRSDIVIRPKLDYRYELLSPTRIVMLEAHRIEYDNKCTFVPTQSLGHCGITQFAPEKQTIFFDETDTFKIIMASDGLWDVFAPNHSEDRIRLHTMDAEQLADLALERWKQEWEVVVDRASPDVIYPNKIPYDSCDDISIITITKT